MCVEMVAVLVVMSGPTVRGGADVLDNAGAKRSATCVAGDERECSRTNMWSPDLYLPMTVSEFHGKEGCCACI